ncbi:MULTISPECIES: SOS response-associated peptidase [unclassified Lentimicrobium]|uniref:SOS response-associated peptidase n=1 Tax=unclassified Lentimicrobium TaxID=2677434 RepID=UPI00155188C8|nr:MULTISPECIES: SOS response-associated peptidase [unclassified Lentimicrobium]NPD46291.1 SOS response-associated peptidase [Lentimicrobium sp. S6]NPD85317.1 SOS response-associated peptidase [Lentimicrobium sp. L6]
MCGRYSFAQLSSEVEKRFKIHVDGNTYVARYNNAPGQKLGVITNHSPKHLSLYHWGLLPSWAQDPRMAFKMINARGETIQEKPAFKEAFSSKRCLVPADGFYEWKKHGKQNIPHYICLKSKEMFAFAGLWEEWKDAEGRIKNTFTIVTTASNEIMKPLHARMPVILPPHLEKEWVENQNTKDLQKMIQPFDSLKMEAFEVNTRINKVENEDSDLILPFQNNKQISLFDED